MRGEGDFVVKMEMEEVGKGVDQSTDSVEFLSFHNNSGSEVEVNDEASVEISIDEESNKRFSNHCFKYILALHHVINVFCLAMEEMMDSSVEPSWSLWQGSWLR